MGKNDFNDPMAGFDDESKGRLITAFKDMNKKTIIDREALANIFQVSKRTVRKMVNRGELPKPMRMAGRVYWIVGVLQKFLYEKALGNKDEN